MKKLILTATLSAGMAIGAYAQGLIAIDNGNNISNNPAAISSGLVFTKSSGSVALEHGNISLSIEGGASAGTLVPIATLLNSAGGVVSGDTFVPGQFTDTSGGSYPVNGVALNGTAFLDVQFWEGNFATYAAAASGGAFVADTGVFTNPTGGGGTPQVLPQDLTGMPSVTLQQVPEPATIALGGLGAAALLLFRRRKQ